MFISREDALAKLNHPDNPFSPSRKGSPDWGRVVDVVETPGDAPSNTTPSSTPVSTEREAETSNPSAREIREILQQVDPAIARNRSALPSKSLRGNIPVQAAIGETAIIIGPTAAGALFDRSVPQTEAYQYGHGMHRSLYGAEKGPPKPELTERLESFKEKLAYAAGRVLETSLDALDEEKIKKLTMATSISRVAKDMAVIMDKCSQHDSSDTAVHFHIYRPDMRSVNAYDTVKINGGTVVESMAAAIPGSSLSTGRSGVPPQILEMESTNVGDDGVVGSDRATGTS